MCYTDQMSAISTRCHRVPRQDLFTGSVASKVTTTLLPTGSSVAYEYHPATSSSSVRTVVTVTVVLGTVFLCLALFVLYRYYMINYNRILLQRQRERAQRQDRSRRTTWPGKLSSPPKNGNTNGYVGRSRGRGACLSR